MIIKGSIVVFNEQEERDILQIKLKDFIVKEMIDRKIRTLTEFSEITGIKRTTLSQILNMHNLPSFYVIWRLVRSLNTNMGVLDSFLRREIHLEKEQIKKEMKNNLWGYHYDVDENKSEETE